MNPLFGLGVFGDTTIASGTLPRLCVTLETPLPSVRQPACAAWTIGAGDGPTAADAPANTTAPAATTKAPPKAAKAVRVSITIPPLRGRRTPSRPAGLRRYGRPPDVSRFVRPVY